MLYGPELKAWRESVGLSAADMSRLLGVKTRTVNYWEAGDDPHFSPELSGDISRAISTLENRLLFLRREIEASSVPVLLAYRSQEDVKVLDPESHLAGVTPEGYRAVLWACRAGKRIRYLEVPEYVRWLGSTPDSLENRALWAQSFEPTPQRNSPGGQGD